MGGGGGFFLMKDEEILGGVVCVCDKDRAFYLCSVAVFNWSLTMPG